MCYQQLAYQIIKVALLPPGLIILLLSLGLLFAGRAAGRRLLWTGTLLLALLSLPVVAIQLMEPLEPYAALDLDAALPADVEAILVLGAGIADTGAEYEGPTLDRISLQRVRYAARLHRATGLPIYVTGGALKSGDPTVADIMARSLREEFSVPVAGVENHSRTTWENAAYSRTMLERDGVSRVFLVSSAWHLPRAMAVCEWAGIAAIPAPTGAVSIPDWRSELTIFDWLPSGRALSNSGYALHEYLGRLWYQLRLWSQSTPEVRPPGQSSGSALRFDRRRPAGAGGWPWALSVVG